MSLGEVHNALALYLARLAPSSQLTMKYVLQDAADRLGFSETDIHDVPWHELQRGMSSPWWRPCARMVTRPTLHRCTSTRFAV